MLERVDRIQLAATDAAEVARAFQEILGAEPAREEASDYLSARRTGLALGVSEIELCAPLGAGIVRAHLDRRGPGLLTAGFSVASVAALRAHLIAEGVESWALRADHQRALRLHRHADPVRSARAAWTASGSGRPERVVH